MGDLLFGLASVFAFYALLLLAAFLVLRFLPASFLGERAKAVLAWVPPFLGGEALRDWAAARAEQAVQKQLAGARDAGLATRLATEIEDGAMRAMLPSAERKDRERVVPCPAEGQGHVGVTGPEVLAIADYIRKNLPPAEQRRIRDMAAENARAIADGKPAPAELPMLPCPLQGRGCVCSVFPARPLRCRPLLAHTVAESLAHSADVSASGPSLPAAVASEHEKIVAQGIERGVSHALQAAGLDSEIYELNRALLVALDDPEAAAKWAKGQKLFSAPVS